MSPPEKDPPMDPGHTAPISEHDVRVRLLNTMTLLSTGFAQLKEHGLGEFTKLNSEVSRLNRSMGDLNLTVIALRKDVTGGGVVVSQPALLLLAAISLMVGIAMGWSAQAILETRSPHVPVRYVYAPAPPEARQDP